jgi:hypothetical protein
MSPSALLVLLSVRGRQLLLRRIDDEYGEQPRRLGITGVGTHSMMRAWALEPELTGPVDADRLVVDLASNLTREDKGVNEGRSGVTMRR